MKIRKNNNKLILKNIIALVLFTYPALKLKLFVENYSTLSLNTRGYLYLLSLGIIIGLLLGRETLMLSNKKYAIIMFLSLALGTCIPHYVPYNLQGNLHLLFAYLGFAGMSIITILNIIKHNINLLKYYIFFMCLSVLIYLYTGMVSTLSELIIMYATVIINYLLIIKHQTN